METYIKNMVCNRCIAAVENIFEKLKIPADTVSLGSVELSQPLTKEKMTALDAELKKYGFEILQDASQKLIENVKRIVIQKISELDIPEDFVLSKFISSKLSKDYSAVSKTFSLNSDITLEQYFILQKIEKVKELLVYNEYTLTEISGMLGYKSVQHLSAQFRKVTGYTPSAFKEMKKKIRIPLDKI